MLQTYRIWYIKLIRCRQIYTSVPMTRIVFMKLMWWILYFRSCCDGFPVMGSRGMVQTTEVLTTYIVWANTISHTMPVFRFVVLWFHQWQVWLGHRKSYYLACVALVENWVKEKWYVLYVLLCAFAINWDTYIQSRNRFHAKGHECVK